jgi:4-hydroxy-tetrahydrodipicolinate synthase
VAEVQARIVTARNAVSRYAQMASIKALLAKRDGHAGRLRQRPPLTALSAQEAAEVQAAFAG